MFEWQKVKLIATTQPDSYVMNEAFDPGKMSPYSAEDLISYCARVSNPANQDNFDTAEKLLKYCIRKKHWSIFEMADLVMEIETTRDIGRQILRHGSFRFQEFSQRYAEKGEHFPSPEYREGRLQDPKNRQNSIETDDTELKRQWIAEQIKVENTALKAYEWALNRGIAKECARVVLPEGLTMSRMYMKGSLRSWFTYNLVRRDGTGTQKEHIDIANKVHAIVSEQFSFVKDIEINE